MITLSTSQRTAFGAVALVALLAGCAGHTPTPVSPAVVQAAPQPAPPPMPTDEQLGTPNATFTAEPSATIAEQSVSTGGSSGTGTLRFNGRRYRFNYAGVTTTGVASQVSPVQGEAFDLKRVTDFAGTYTATAMGPDRKEAVLRNEKGIYVRMQAVRPFKGLESVTISLTR
jgi:hypothetical protein